MMTKEDKVRADIVTKFGSIPKMAKAIGMPRNTIYHALERGLDNTTRKTSNAILDALYGDITERFVLTKDEINLINLYRSLTAESRDALMVVARTLVKA